jgi:hypothetical protein
MTQSVDQIRILFGEMRKVLDAYSTGNVEVSALADGLEPLINALAAFADRAWVEEMRTGWGGIEIPNAVSLDEGRSELNADEQRSVDDAVAALRSMLEEY